MLSKFVGTFDNPREDMVFANKGTTHFALEQDRALLCAVDKYGYGNWDSVREDIRNDDRLKFQHAVQGMTTGMITKRCDYRMRQMEKELEAREKVLKNQRPPNVVAAQKALDAIMKADEWDLEAIERELRGGGKPLMVLSEESKLVEEERLKDRQNCIDKLREIEIQLHRCKVVADETRQAIYRGDQVCATASGCGQTVHGAPLFSKLFNVLVLFLSIRAVRQLQQYHLESCRNREKRVVRKTWSRRYRG